ncbi:ABC transporter substrate-binding protein [Streptomyces sp. MAR4 CNX-425]|uniref:ABC transporter substrate-binding protein n=1 Tax=Streptomyces sp. MAR4 CNX-425 TaxID=3406343 RepID=UPI003B506039
MPTTRGIRLAVAALAAATFATACGLGGSADEGDSADAAGGEVKGEITFQTLQLKPTFTDYIEGVIDDFEKQHPGTEVKWVDIPFEGAQEKITADASAGSLPDVVNLNPQFAQALAAKGMFVDMDQVAGDVEDEYVPGAWEAFTVAGKPGSFGIPWYLTSEVTMYNKEHFRQAGLDPDKPPATFDELLADGEKLAAAGDGERYGIHPALENRFITDLAKQGVPIIADDGRTWTFNTPRAEKYLASLVEAYQSGVYPKDSLTQDHSKETEAYQGGRIGLFPSGPNFLTIIKENAPGIAEQTGVGPQITGESGVTNMSVMGNLVPKSSDNQATAVAFSKFIGNAENQLAFSKIVTVLPSTEKSLENPYFTAKDDDSLEAEARRISAAQITKAENLVPVQYDQRVTQAVIGQVELALKGDQSPREALDKAVEAADAITQK